MSRELIRQLELEREKEWERGNQEQS
jgi:hypothetical protein